jgi:formate hydrogenlyase subunit 3/multisubunit Na+/H+ antiporter MnhD subunit
MTALAIWSLIPGLFALSLYSLRRWEKAIHATGVLFALFLAWLAWQLPIGETIALRLWPGFPIFTIQPEQFIYGNRFILDNTTRPVLTLLYLGAAFWIGGAGPARTHRLFAPLSLLLTSVLAAALAADSVSPAAMLIAVAALVSVPLLSSPGKPAARGVSRYLIFQITGVCLILFADAELVIATTPRDTGQPSLIPALLALALGFALILAVVPFHTWLPMLAEETHPYAAAFVFFLLPNMVALLALEILIRYSLIGLPAGTFAGLQYAGVLLALAGGIGAAFNRHLGRVLGFAAVAQIGMTLLAISLNNQPGRATPLIGIYFSQLLPQAIGLAIWGLALAILRFYLPELSYTAVRGAARRLPVASMTLVIANLSLAGLPFLASFPVYVALWSSLSLRSFNVALACLIGCAGVMAAGLRTLATLVAAPSDMRWQISESRSQVILLFAGAGLLILVGLFPQYYMPILTNMAITFANPAP